MPIDDGAGPGGKGGGAGIGSEAFVGGLTDPGTVLGTGH